MSWLFNWRLPVKHLRLAHTAVSLVALLIHIIPLCHFFFFTPRLYNYCTLKPLPGDVKVWNINVDVESVILRNLKISNLFVLNRIMTILDDILIYFSPIRSFYSIQQFQFRSISEPIPKFLFFFPDNFIFC